MLTYGPYRYQPRGTNPANRRRTQSLVRIGVVAAVLFFLTLYVFTRGGGDGSSSVLSIFSLGLLSSGGADFQLETVRYHDLSNVQGTARGWEREERILVCVPLRDAEAHLSMFFSHLRNLTYPHHLLDLAFLVSDSKDNTMGVLVKSLEDIQAAEEEAMHFGEISIIEKDFGQVVNQDVESRHGFAAQAGRRKLMARARNWLLTAALRPYHSWVYWRDVDVETAPFTILEDLMRHNKDVIVPSEYIPTWAVASIAQILTALCRCVASIAGVARWRAAVRSEFVAGVRHSADACRYARRGCCHCRGVCRVCDLSTAFGVSPRPLRRS